MAQERTSATIFFCPSFVLDRVLQPEQLGEGLLLLGSRQPLRFEVHQAFLVSVDDEFAVLQVRSPLVDGNDHSQVFLLVGGEALVTWRQCFAHESDGVPPCCSTAPMPC